MTPDTLLRKNLQCGLHYDRITVRLLNWGLTFNVGMQALDSLLSEDKMITFHKFWRRKIWAFYTTFSRICNRLRHVISSVCHSVNVLLGCYRALIGTWLPTFWDNLSVPSSGVKQCCVTAHRPYRLCLSQNAYSTLQVCNRRWKSGIIIIKKILTDPSHLIILKCILMMTLTVLIWV